MADEITAAGKYLLISVPEFDKDPISGKQMTSYLRLGASSIHWQKDPGGDLAARIAEAGPTGGRLSPDAVPVSPAGDSPRPVFVDDLRFRDGFGGPHGLDVGERLRQSSVLHTRGGWRDHSDGNRITTTYGDKVEIIRGNYKMIVLGRQDDDFASSAGMDLSGQHMQTFGLNNPSLIRVEWTQDLGGVWHVQDTSEGVVHTENFAGDEYMFRWGLRHESTTGSEAPTDADPTTGATRQNPKIIDKTWAEKIESYTGSAAWRIPTIKEETWAKETSSVTDVSGSMNSTITAGSISETTTVAGAINRQTTAASSSEINTISAINSLTTAGTINEMTTVGTKKDLLMAGATVEITLADNETDIFVGASTVELKAAGFQFDANIGYRLELNSTKKYVYTLVEDMEFNPKKNMVSMAHTLNAITASIVAIDTQITSARVKVMAALVEIGPPGPLDALEVTATVPTH